jgi:hypothetical protein
VYQVCEERSRLLGLYYETVEWHARLVAQLREAARSADHVLFEQLLKRSEEFRLHVKRGRDNLFKHRKQHGC